MTEDVLQYIWKTQAFSKSSLKSVEGEKIEVRRQGILNSDSGPDFSEARISVGDVEWVGDVEIHILASAWKAHKHNTDVAYNKVILHVVWENDFKVTREDGSEMPTLELKELVDTSWLKRYDVLQASIKAIPCEPRFREVGAIHKLDAFNKALIERLQRKSESVLHKVKQSRGDWDLVAIQVLFEFFGFKKNNEAFLQLFSLVDPKIIRKVSSLKQMEAYLFGLAGFLGASKGIMGYQKELKEEYLWMKKKFNLSVESMTLTWWKFMRMRPANFPTLRIAQLSAILFKEKHLFQQLIANSETRSIEMFSINVSVYWQSHYHFNKEAKSRIAGIGEQSRRTLSINVVAALLVAYGNYTNNEAYINKAIEHLEHLKPENNVITRGWKEIGMKLHSAAESQGAIELFNSYCKNHKCLECNIGNQLLRN